jgi:hypothetical protein
VEEWYKRDGASWVPHKIYRGFVPFCSNCKRSDQDTVTGSRWINKLKTLFCLDDYYYFDTKRYPRRRFSNSFFSGDDEVSLQLGGTLTQCSFPFHLTKRMLIDFSVYIYLTKRMSNSPIDI